MEQTRTKVKFVTKGFSSGYALTLTDQDGVKGWCRLWKVRVQISQFLCDGFATLQVHKFNIHTKIIRYLITPQNSAQWMHPSHPRPIIATVLLGLDPMHRCCQHPRSCGCSLAPMSSLTLLDYIVAWRVRYLISSSAVQMICHIERYLAPESFLSVLWQKSYLWTLVMKESDRAHSQIIFPT